MTGTYMLVMYLHRHLKVITIPAYKEISLEQEPRKAEASPRSSGLLPASRRQVALTRTRTRSALGLARGSACAVTGREGRATAPPSSGRQEAAPLPCAPSALVRGRHGKGFPADIYENQIS